MLNDSWAPSMLKMTSLGEHGLRSMDTSSLEPIQTVENNLAKHSLKPSLAIKLISFMVHR